MLHALLALSLLAPAAAEDADPEGVDLEGIEEILEMSDTPQDEDEPADWAPAPDEPEVTSASVGGTLQSVRFDLVSRRLLLTWADRDGADTEGADKEEQLDLSAVMRLERARQYEALPDELFILLADGRRLLLSTGSDVTTHALLIPSMTGLVLEETPSGRGHSSEPTAPPTVVLGQGMEVSALGGSSLQPVTPVAESAGETEPALSGEGGGVLGRHQIEPVIREGMPAFQRCYQKELQRNPGLAGTVELRFVIDRDGTVKIAQIKASTIGNSLVEACLQEEILRRRFPKPSGSGTVVVSYPFRFASGT